LLSRLRRIFGGLPLTLHLVLHLRGFRFAQHLALSFRIEQLVRKLSPTRFAPLAAAIEDDEVTARTTRLLSGVHSCSTVLAYVDELARQPSPRTGRPLGVLARRGHISALSQFFRNTAAWEWEDVPGRPLLGSGDCPRMPMRIPRFIPPDELERLMAAVAKLECPYQRTALLIARWTGARKGEIQRLAVDCLDRYPDSTPRLRLPPGKTYRERIVPLHREAADALTRLIALRQAWGPRA
jgi:integrase